MEEEQSEKKTLQFEIDQNTYEKLEIACQILHTNLQDQFLKWTQITLKEAALELSKNTSLGDDFANKKKEMLSLETVKERIIRWKSRPENINYQMIQSFFKAEKREENEQKDFRTLMFEEFGKTSPVNDNIDRFNRNLRAMSSNSLKAYGAVFKIVRSSSNAQTKIMLHPDVEEFLRSYEKDFIK